jgi:predicted P-loop ATPase
LFRLTKDLAKALPEADPVAIAELFAPSLDLMSRDAPDCPGVDVVLEKLGRALEDSDAGPWTGRLATSENGIPKACLGNAVLAIENHNATCDVLAYDERRQVEVFVKPPPWGGVVPRDVADDDATRCAVWLTEVQRITASAEMCRKALDAVARARSFDRVRDYLRALVWDGVPRLDTWLIDYAGAPDTPFVRAVSAKFLIAAVARTLSPGCKVDTMLVLEGKQGIGKSSLLRALAGPENFADDLPDIENKDAKDYLQGPWIIENKELRGFDRKEESARKAFLDQRVDLYRAAYAAKKGWIPRRCVFAGTTNDSEYLRDSTGNRRYWPVSVRWCDVVRIVALRDQLWAEAVARFKAGETWWLDEEQERGAQVEQEQRQEADPWEGRITHALEAGVQKRGFQRVCGGGPEWGIPPAAPHVSVSEILEYAIGLPAGNWNRSHEMRAAAILKNGGWTRSRMGPTRMWRYQRGPTPGVANPLARAVDPSQPQEITRH